MDLDQAVSGGKRRVLVVDDHPDTTEVLAVLLGLLGFETRCAARGRDVLQCAREFDPELILLDIGLPDINGFEVVHALRADARLAARVIVAVSGWSRPQDLARAKRTGFDDYLIKPIDLGKLREVLRISGTRAQGLHAGSRTCVPAPTQLSQAH